MTAKQLIAASSVLLPSKTVLVLNAVLVLILPYVLIKYKH